MWRVHFNCENGAENVRQRFARQPYFNVYEAFNSLDLDGSGKVEAGEIKRLIESRGFYVTHKEADSVLKKFDKDGDNHMTYSEVSKRCWFKE